MLNGLNDLVDRIFNLGNNSGSSECLRRRKIEMWVGLLIVIAVGVVIVISVLFTGGNLSQTSKIEETTTTVVTKKRTSAFSWNIGEQFSTTDVEVAKKPQAVALLQNVAEDDGDIITAKPDLPNELAINKPTHYKLIANENKFIYYNFLAYTSISQISIKVKNISEFTGNVVKIVQLQGTEHVTTKYNVCDIETRLKPPSGKHDYYDNEFFNGAIKGEEYTLQFSQVEKKPDTKPYFGLRFTLAKSKGDILIKLHAK